MRNSIDALRQMPRREIAFRTAVGEDGFVEIVISDTGPGLPPEILDRLFQPFVTTKPNGTGIGLSISRSIIESHGGRLAPVPSPGGGAAFRFTLPVAASRDEAEDG